MPLMIKKYLKMALPCLVDTFLTLHGCLVSVSLVENKLRMILTLQVFSLFVPIPFPDRSEEPIKQFCISI